MADDENIAYGKGVSNASLTNVPETENDEVVNGCKSCKSPSAQYDITRLHPENDQQSDQWFGHNFNCTVHDVGCVNHLSLPEVHVDI